MNYSEYCVQYGHIQGGHRILFWDSIRAHTRDLGFHEKGVPKQTHTMILTKRTLKMGPYLLETPV